MPVVSILRFLSLFALLAGASAFAAPPIIPLKEVKPGLKGECRTVFSGTKIETFSFEVMGVAKDYAGPGRDIIWCRMKTDPTGQMVVAGGMSGSPCYIDGRMMGALAYGWIFNKDPIFGVQPIESMLEVLDFKGKERSTGLFAEGPSRVRETDRPPAISKTPLLEILAGFQRPFMAASRGDSPQHLPLSIEVSRLHPLVADRMLAGLAEAGFSAFVSGGGGTSRSADEGELEPGAPLTGVVARGDLNLAATGTLTWRDGNRILAFGHPFLNAGAVSIPCGRAEIIGVVSSYMRSFKMSNKGRVVGTLTQDRMSAVGGVIGKVPSMTPMEVRIQHPGHDRRYKLEFCDNKFFTPIIFQLAVDQFLAEAMENNEETTIRFRSRVEFENAPPLILEDAFAGERFEWVDEAVRSLAMQLMPLYENEFGTPAIRRVSVEADLQPVLDRVRLEEAAVEPREVQPGETLKVRATFLPWHGKRFQREYSVKLPEEVKGGEVTVILADAEHADQIDGASSSPFAILRSSSSSARPRSLEQLIRVLNDRHRSNRLYVFLQQKAEGLYVQDRRMTALPESIRNLLQNDQTANRPAAIHDSVLSKTAVDFDSVVEGSRSVTVKIK
jgi:hypothetical protein